MDYFKYRVQGVKWSRVQVKNENFKYKKLGGKPLDPGILEP